MTEEKTWTWTLRGEEFVLPVEMPLSVTFAFGRFGRALAGDDTAKMSGLADLEDATRGLFGDDFVRFMAQNPTQRELLDLFGEAATRAGVDSGESSASSTSSTDDADRSSPTSSGSTVSTST